VAIPALWSLTLRSGDRLAFTVEADVLPALWATIGLEPALTPVPMDAERQNHRLVEVVVASPNPAVGRLVSELPVRDEPVYRASIVALSRNGQAQQTPIRDVRINSGDGAILEVEDSFFYETRDETDFLITKRLKGFRIRRTSRALTASIITLLMIVAAAAGWMSMLNAALLGTFAMLLTGCMGVRTAWRSIEFDTVVVLAAAVGLESVISASGLAQVLADGLTALSGDNPYVALTVVFIGCIIMTNLITNAAAAAFMFPVAVSIAWQLDASFMPFAVILMLGTSYAFINPAGYQTNLMVQGPGNYSFMDFARIGLPVTIIAGIVVLILAPLVYPF
jgi:hypothetical protein